MEAIDARQARVEGLTKTFKALGQILEQAESNHTEQLTQSREEIGSGGVQDHGVQD